MDLRIKEIPVPKGHKHPKPRSSILPTHEFTFGVVAPKGQGKTTLLMNLIMFYKDYFNQIIVFSPTARNDEKWLFLKDQDVLVENVKLKKFLKNIQGKGKGLVTNQQVVLPPEVPFERKITNIYTEFKQEQLMEIMEEQDALIQMLEELDKSKHIADRILLYFDDLVGSELFSSRKDDPFKILNTTHRHLSTSILMVTQAYKEIPKTIRTNFTCLIILKIFSQTELESIQKEYPMEMYPKEWQAVYDYCTSEEFSFLFYNTKMPKGKRIMKKFTEIVGISGKTDNEYKVLSSEKGDKQIACEKGNKRPRDDINADIKRNKG